jgi:hypothetical protein
MTEWQTVKSKVLKLALDRPATVQFRQLCDDDSDEGMLFDTYNNDEYVKSRVKCFMLV